MPAEELWLPHSHQLGLHANAHDTHEPLQGSTATCGYVSVQGMLVRQMLPSWWLQGWNLGRICTRLQLQWPCKPAGPPASRWSLPFMDYQPQRAGQAVAVISSVTCTKQPINAAFSICMSSAINVLHGLILCCDMSKGCNKQCCPCLLLCTSNRQSAVLRSQLYACMHACATCQRNPSC